MLPRAVCNVTVPVRAAGITLALLILAGTGCASRTYRATSLPAEFIAPVTQNIEEIDLSRLANYSASGQLIHCGDVLEVTIRTDLDSHTAPPTRVRVGDDGTAYVPLVGRIGLVGLELPGAEQTIASVAVSSGVFHRPPYVTVTMHKEATNRITVIGAVNEQGLKELPRGSSSLLNALVAAGGLSEEAGQDVAIRRPVGRGEAPNLIRPPQQHVAGGSRTELTTYEMTEAGGSPAAEITRVNLATAATEGNGGRYLEDGDVVIVSKRAPKPIYVMGLVRKPGEFELPASKDMYLLDALAKAGDRTMQVADKVIIIRRVPGQEEPIVIQTSIREAKKTNGLANVRLAPGDIVSVEETPATVVLDALKSFIRFGMSSSVPLF